MGLREGGKHAFGSLPNSLLETVEPRHTEKELRLRADPTEGSRCSPCDETESFFTQFLYPYLYE